MNAVIKWMTEHPVAANLTMIFVILAGMFSASTLPQKTFPEFTLDAIAVSVEYQGATPEEVTQSIIRPIEEQISGIDGIDQITATALSGRGSLTVQLFVGVDVAEKLDEIRTEIDSITSFPTEAEDPTVIQASNQTRVLELMLFGPASERVLKEEAERLKDELLELSSVSLVQTANTRPYEVSVEVDRDTLNAYGLTIADIGQVIAANSLELTGGEIETDALSIPLRTLGRNFNQADFESIVLLTNADGAQVRLGDVARVVDGFEDTDLLVNFNSQPAAAINVFRVGNEQVLDIVDQVQNHLDTEFRPTLPEGLDVRLWQNDAEELGNRLNLLIDNAILGLTLVVICLALFLDLRLAFWAAWGIGIAFAASFVVLQILGMSINQISLFGFILAIGIVVDNAIVIGENIYKNGEKGERPMAAAVKGAQRVAIPVIFSALTTIVAFVPLLQLPGVLGKFLGDIPTVVITVLTLSLIQSLIILPRNLASLDVDPNRPRNIVFRTVDLLRRPVDAGVKWFIRVPLDALLRFSVRRFLVPIAMVIALMTMTIGLLAHGFVRFEFFPSIEGKIVTADIEMNDGTTVGRTAAVAEIVRSAAERAGERIQATLPEDHPAIMEGALMIVGQGPFQGGPEGGSAAAGGELANVVVRLIDPAFRDFPTSTYEDIWREEIGTLTGVKRLSISASLVDPGAPIALEMSLPDAQDISPVVQEVRDRLAAIPGVFDIEDNQSGGKLEYTLSLKDEARVYGLTLQNLATQVRDAYQGLEATRVQRGADDVKVFVRLPSEERNSIADLYDTSIRTPAGALIPLETVATLNEGRAPAQISRRDGRTITTVTADVDVAVVTSNEANAIITSEIIPDLSQQYPDLAIAFGGEQETQGDAQVALQAAGLGALFVIYALLALIFRSYWKPIVVMIAIPLGLIGAITGHLIMGIPLTLLSIFGIIGLSGVVINNSLVMIDLYNEYLEQGMEPADAVVEGTKDRFRPILLTSVTTFLGIFPLISEQSLQAQFLIPLGVSIGYGVLLGTVIILLAVPAVFMLFLRVGQALSWLWTKTLARAFRPVEVG
ncbi:MAG: efflux RND transporter permease subunit [Pseudomonadota bacterium]